MTATYKYPDILESYVSQFKTEFDAVGIERVVKECRALYQKPPVADGFEFYPDASDYEPAYVLDVWELFPALPITTELFPLTTGTNIPGLIYSSAVLLPPQCNFDDVRTEFKLNSVFNCIYGQIIINNKIVLPGSPVVVKETIHNTRNDTDEMSVGLIIEIKDVQFD